MQRVFLSDNGTLTDYTIEARNSDTIPAELIAGEDYIYIGSWDPMNNFFLEMHTANTNAATMTLEYWSNSEWVEVVDLIDATKSSGNTLAQTGCVQWIPDRDKLISRVNDTTASDATPTELNNIEIYERFWIRLSPTADLSAGTAIKTLFYRFADSAKLYSLDPILSNYLGSWQTGKANWDEQLMIASEEVVLDLRRRGIIRGSEELINRKELELMTAYKALTIIYSGLGGKDEIQKANDCAKKYHDLAGNMRFTVDVDNDARLNVDERSIQQGRLVR